MAAADATADLLDQQGGADQPAPCSTPCTAQTFRLPPDLVAGRLQHPGRLIQPIGRDEDEVAVETRSHPHRHASGR
jgi:hypothetical protein